MPTDSIQLHNQDTDHSAGLSADKISEMTGIFDEKLKIHFCKGNISE